MRVTTRSDVESARAAAAAVVKRETTTTTFESQVETFWENLQFTGFSPRLAENVWVANRCMQLNAQQISRMPLRFYGSFEPAWVDDPDPNWYPNGIGDAVFSSIWSMYAYGDAFLYITSTYASGWPSGWTVLDPEPMTVESRRGRRVYYSGQDWLDPDRVVQISRDPRGGLRGTPALRSAAASVNNMTAAQSTSRSMMTNGIPTAVLKMLRKVSDEQALKVQQQWVDRTSVRRGAPAVLPPEIDFQQLSFSPADLMLLDQQNFDARAICAMLGVPALFLNLGISDGGMNYQSPAMLGEHWWRFELRPMSKAFSQGLSEQMLPRGASVEFDATDTLAPSFKDLADTWIALAKEGHVTTEELRAAVLRLPPQTPEESMADILAPTGSGTSNEPLPSASVVELRPG